MSELNVVERSARVTDFFELDPDRGVLRNRFDKGRVFILSANAFRIIQEGLYEAYSTGGPAILHQMGRSYGRALARNKIAGETEVKFVTDLQMLGSAAGWGRIELTGSITSDKDSKLVFRNCVFCAASPSSNKPECYFLVGMVQGVSDEVFPNRFKAFEENCMRKGDKNCEIILHRTA
ncbi:MAG: hypothetical protein HY619_06455 [Thaumarchaeota archaeon]|nr:hypothetical protein [Nitrososphaerota archaeon]